MNGIDPDVQAGFDRLEFAAREAEAKEAGAAPSQPATAAPQAASAWKEEAALIASILPALAPNWTIAPEHKAMIGDAFAALGDKYFPGGFGAFADWGPWAQLLAGLGMVALSNFDFATFKLKPLRIPASEAATAAHEGETVRPAVATDAPPPPVTSTRRAPRKRKPKKKGGKDAGN